MLIPWQTQCMNLINSITSNTSYAIHEELLHMGTSWTYPSSCMVQAIINAHILPAFNLSNFPHEVFPSSAIKFLKYTKIVDEVGMTFQTVKHKPKFKSIFHCFSLFQQPYRAFNRGSSIQCSGGCESLSHQLPGHVQWIVWQCIGMFLAFNQCPCCLQ